MFVCLQSKLKRSLHKEEKLGFSEPFLSTVTFLVNTRVYVLNIYYSLGIIDIFRLRIQIKTGHFTLSLLLKEDINSCVQKKFTKTQFFVRSLSTDLFSVLCTETLSNSVCELCSVLYIGVCLHSLCT